MLQQSPGKMEEIAYYSSDAPPLDFSFKNIKNLEELKTIQPRQGNRKPIQTEQQKIKEKIQVQAQQIEKKQSKEINDPKLQKKKQQIVKLVPSNNINSVVAGMVNASNLKNISTKAKEQLEKKKKKVISVKLMCCSLMLGYNKIRQLNTLEDVLPAVIDNFSNLQWIDLSHNYLTNLTYYFKGFPNLKSLYLHCNYLYDITELAGLSQCQSLKAFTIHGNPIASIPNFRILVISVLPQIRKLDSVLISNKQRDNSKFLGSQLKKMPQPKNIIKPPIEKNQEQEQKQVTS